MRRVVLVAAVVAIVIGGAAWALWPAAKWPQAFCAPVTRMMGTDADAVAKSFSHRSSTLTVTQVDRVATLFHDAQLAEANAPTAQLRAELNRYLVELGVVLSTNIVTDAMIRFDQKASTQLRACGVIPTVR